MTQLQSNSLSVSAESVRDLIDASDKLAAQSVEKALEAGHLLIAAKAQCKHGEWLPFLKRAGVGERKAQRLMKLAASGLNPSAVTDLGGIRGALEFLTRRAKAARHFDEALASVLSGGYGTAELEAALLLEDEMIEMFPEEKRGPLRRHRPEHDVTSILKRIAQIKTEEPEAA